MSVTRPSLIVPAALLVFMTLAGCGPGGINGSVNVPEGGSEENATTINGGVNVGDGARVGQAATVNGGVRIGQNATVDSAKTVNGGISIGRGTRVSEDVVTVNGGVRLGEGSDVTGEIVNVNGGISLSAAHVGRGITTINGDIHIGRGSHVEGGIRVKKPDADWSSHGREPRIVIGPESVVDGPLKFERPVRLYVSNTAKIGKVEGATPESFDGERPHGNAHRERSRDWDDTVDEDMQDEASSGEDEDNVPAPPAPAAPPAPPATMGGPERV